MNTSINLKTKSLMIVFIIASIIICVLFASQNSYAYADESCQFEGEIQATQESNDWEDAAEQDRINSTYAADGKSLPYEEISGEDRNTFYIHDRFNLIKVTRNGKDFSFKFNFRGYIGEPHGSHRSANVQYFFNSDTKEMVFLTFGKGEEGFETYTYHGTFDTVFEDSICYYNDNVSIKYVLADNVEKCYLDPKITKIGQYNFQCFKKLNEVDIINQDYDNVNMEIGDCAFRKAGYSEYEYWDTIVKMPFLKAFSKEKVKELLRDDKNENKRARWAEYCALEFDNVKYYAARSDWKDDAKEDRYFSTFSGYDGISKPYHEIPIMNMYGTSFIPDNFNVIKRTINGKEFSFKYDLRGDIGEAYERSPSVQFFHNTQTKDTVLLTFGNGSEGFETYTQHGYGDTVFEKRLNCFYGDCEGFYYTIAHQAKTCYLDPKITKIGYHTFQCCEELQFVDFIENGSNPNLEIGDDAFYKTNRDHGCEVAFMEAFSQDKINKLLSEDERGRWAEYCPVIFRGTKYKPA